MSLPLQKDPSLQLVPLGTATAEQVPPLHWPVLQESSNEEQSMGVPLQFPDVHSSDWVHASPSSQLVPFVIGTAAHAPALH